MVDSSLFLDLQDLRSGFVRCPGQRGILQFSGGVAELLDCEPSCSDPVAGDAATLTPALSRRARGDNLLLIAASAA
jgi:hypothetical protein